MRNIFKKITEKGNKATLPPRTVLEEINDIASKISWAEEYYPLHAKDKLIAEAELNDLLAKHDDPKLTEYAESRLDYERSITASIDALSKNPDASDPVYGNDVAQFHAHFSDSYMQAVTQLEQTYLNQNNKEKEEADLTESPVFRGYTNF